MRIGINRTLGIAIALAMTATIFGSSPARADGTCVRNGSTLNINIQGSGNEFFSFAGFTLSRDPGGDIKLVEVDFPSADPIDCGDASVTNVDFIDVQGSSTSEDLGIDMADGGFAPGATTEATVAASEIEINVSLAGGEDVVFIQGTTGPDEYYMGTKGVNVNGDGDGNDVVLDPDIELPSLFGNNGKDRLSASGTFSTGGPSVVPVALVGGVGNDSLNGGSAGDLITGQVGNDLLIGAGGNDRLGENPHPAASGSSNEDGKDDLRGGTGGDVLRGGEGDDTLSGGPQEDEEHGGDGDDVFRQLGKPDGSDLIFGGLDFDTTSYALRTRNEAVKASLDGKRNDGGSREKDSLGYKGDLEALTGGRGTDRLIGNGGPNTLNGGAQDDFLDGRGGTDNCNGGPGNNTEKNCEV